MIRYFIVLTTLWLVACSKELPATRPVIPEPRTDYEKRLVATKLQFQFEHWPVHARNAVLAVFEQLLVDLIKAGEGATEAQKIQCFDRAVATLNDINRKDLSVIETGEAGQLIDLGNQVAKAAGLDPKKYGHGEGPLSAGRDW